MAFFAMKPVEIGVCQAPVNGVGAAGVWGFHIVQIPATTPEEQILTTATRKYLEMQESAHIYHTWVQCVGDAVEEEVGDEDTV